MRGHRSHPGRGAKLPPSRSLWTTRRLAVGCWTPGHRGVWRPRANPHRRWLGPCEGYHPPSSLGVLVVLEPGIVISVLVRFRKVCRRSLSLFLSSVALLWLSPRASCLVFRRSFFLFPRAGRLPVYQVHIPLAHRIDDFHSFGPFRAAHRHSFDPGGAQLDPISAATRRQLAAVLEARP